MGVSGEGLYWMTVVDLIQVFEYIYTKMARAA
jgi:hypothetical protein